MKTVVFAVPGRPIPKGRPQFNRKTGSVYTPRRTKEYEEIVAYSCLPWSGAFSGPVRYTAWFHTNTRADLDNLVKSSLDGIQAANVFGDDRQVHEIHAYFGAVDKEEEARVMLEEMGG